MAAISTSSIVPSRGIGSVRVLIVDDQLAVLELLRRILEALGLSIIISKKNPNEAFDYLVENEVDIVFLDWIMPNMNGIEFTKKVRESLSNKNRFVPIIMLSGRTTAEDIQNARDAGITEFLAKPFTIQQICDRVISVVERPRYFVLAPGFKGPDRRRRHEEAEEERRGPSPIDKHRKQQ